MSVIITDGGRAAAGFKGNAGDCAVRAIAIALELDYRFVYDAINEIAQTEKRPKNRKASNARLGVFPATITTFVARYGWEWVPTMSIGSGTTVHLRADELPGGRIIARVTKHFVAVIDGIIHDTHDPSRDGTRAVYGYWKPAQ